MNYVTSYYYVLIAIVFILYYALPLKIRWLALLAGSLAFYLLLWQKRTVVVVFFLTILISCLCGIVLGRLSDRSRRSLKPDKILRRFALILSLILCSLPFLAAKAAGFASDFHFDFLSSRSLLIPLGCSFYTMQIIAYLVDVSKGSVTPQYNILKYTLPATSTIPISPRPLRTSGGGGTSRFPSGCVIISIFLLAATERGKRGNT